MGPALRCPATACAGGLTCNLPACRDADAKLQTGRRGFEKLGRHVWSWASCLQAVDKHEWLEPGRDSHIAYTFAGDVGDRPFPVGDHTCDTSAPQPGRLLSLADPQLLAAWRVHSRPYFTKHLTHVPGGTCTAPAAAGEWQCTEDGCTVAGSDDDANTLAAEPQWCDGHSNSGTCEHRHTALKPGYNCPTAARLRSTRYVYRCEGGECDMEDDMCLNDDFEGGYDEDAEGEGDGGGTVPTTEEVAEAVWEE